MSDSSPIVSLSVEIARDELLHFLEYPPGHQPPARIDKIAAAVLPEARALAAAQGCFLELPVDRAAELGLPPVDAAGLVIGLVTAGPAIEEQAGELVKGGELTRGLIMDAAGSAAAEEAADRLSAHIVGEGSEERTAAVSCRLSPGYGSWKLEAQRALFPLLPHVQLGVELNDSCLMMPRKSISFAMWLGAREPIGTGIAGCEGCAHPHCRYRRKAQRQGTGSPESRQAESASGGQRASSNQDL
ncbi:MAG: hypothetical protein JRI68_05345 [Deltaproteobacteria bacterium]|nr:hypothetical protein [Deltaproteobacteria bacterium]